MPRPTLDELFSSVQLDYPPTGGERGQFRPSLDEIYSEIFAEIPRQQMQPQPSVFKEAIKAFPRGVGGTGLEIVGQALQTIDKPGGKDIVRDIGKELEDVGVKVKEHPWVKMGDVSRLSDPSRFLVQGIETFGQAIPSAIVGAGAGTIAGGIPGAAIGALTSPAVTFGLSAKEQKRRQLEKEAPHLAPDEIDWLSTKAGLWEGGTELAGNLISGLMLLGGPVTAPAGIAARTMVKDLLKVPLKEAAKRVAKTMPIEVGSELAASLGQRGVDIEAGLPVPSVAETMYETFGPAFVATVLFGTAASGLNMAYRNKLEKALEDGNADVKTRVKAADEVYKKLQGIDEELARNWMEFSGDFITQKLPIPVSLEIKTLKKQAEAETKQAQEAGIPTEQPIAGIILNKQEREILENIEALRQQEMEAVAAIPEAPLAAVEEEPIQPIPVEVAPDIPFERGTMEEVTGFGGPLAPIIEAPSLRRETPVEPMEGAFAEPLTPSEIALEKLNDTIEKDFGEVILPEEVVPEVVTRDIINSKTDQPFTTRGASEAYRVSKGFVDVVNYTLYETVEIGKNQFVIRAKEAVPTQKAKLPKVKPPKVLPLKVVDFAQKAHEMVNEHYLNQFKTPQEIDEEIERLNQKAKIDKILYNEELKDTKNKELQKSLKFLLKGVDNELIEKRGLLQYRKKELLGDDPSTPVAARTIFGKATDQHPLLPHVQNNIRRIISNVAGAWKHRIHIKQTMGELPEHIQNYINSQPRPETIMAVFDPPTQNIYIIADRISSVKEMQIAIVHEITHLGLREWMKGDDFKSLLNQVYFNYTAACERIAFEYEYDTKTEIGRQKAAEEVLANLPYTSKNQNILIKLYQAVRRWLFAHGFNINFTNEEIHGLVQQARKKVRDGKVIDKNNGEPVFERKEMPSPLLYAKLEGLVRNKMPNKMTWQDVIPFFTNNGISQDEINLLLFSDLITIATYKPELLTTPISKDTVLGIIMSNKINFRLEKITESPDEIINSLKIKRKETRSKARGLALEIKDRGAYLIELGKIEDLAEEEYVLTTHKKMLWEDLMEKGGKNPAVLFLTLPNAKDATIDLNSGMLKLTDAHWVDGHMIYSPIKNPIARFRITDRITPRDGNTILFVEEFQPPITTSFQNMPKWAQKRWRELGVKSLIDYAVRNGYSGIAWTRGEQQIARYENITDISEGGVATFYDKDLPIIFNRIGKKYGDMVDSEDMGGMLGTVPIFRFSPQLKTDISLTGLPVFARTLSTEPVVGITKGSELTEEQQRIVKKWLGPEARAEADGRLTGIDPSFSHGDLRTDIHDARRMVREVFETISYQMERISPTVFHALNKVWIQEKMIRAARDEARVIPFIESFKHLPQSEKEAMQEAMLNDDKERAIQIGVKNGMKAADIVEGYIVREELGNEAEKAGFEFTRIKDSWPRWVIDYNGLMQAVYGTEQHSAMQDALAAYAEKSDKTVAQLTREEKSIVLDLLVRGFPIERITLGKPSPLIERSIKKIPAHLLKYYAMPDVSLVSSIKKIRDAIAMATFFGKHKRVKGIGADIISEDDIKNSVGDYIVEAKIKGELHPVDEPVFRDLMQTLWRPTAASYGTRLYKNVIYMQTLMQFLPSLTQLIDIGLSTYKIGFGYAAKGLLKKPLIDLKELGIKRVAEEMELGQEAFGKQLNWMFDYTLFNRMDKFGKMTLVNGRLYQMIDQAKAGNLELRDYISTVLGADKVDTTIQDLISGNVKTDDILFMLVAKLAESQPITALEVPPKYHKMNFGKTFYALKTYQVKLLNMMKKDMWDKVVRGYNKGNIDYDMVRDGLYNFSRLAVTLWFLGMGTDWLKNWLLGREFDMPDVATDNLWRTVGFNKYAMSKMMDGLGQGLIEQMAPPVGVLNALPRDWFEYWDKGELPKGSRSTQFVPMAGKMYYWWFGRGSEIKREEAMDLIKKRMLKERLGKEGYKRYEEIQEVKKEQERERAKISREKRLQTFEKYNMQ